MTMFFKAAGLLHILVASQANLTKPSLGDLNPGDTGLGRPIFGDLFSPVIHSLCTSVEGSPHHLRCSSECYADHLWTHGTLVFRRVDEVSAAKKAVQWAFPHSWKHVKPMVGNFSRCSSVLESGIEWCLTYFAILNFMYQCFHGVPPSSPIRDIDIVSATASPVRLCLPTAQGT